MLIKGAKGATVGFGPCFVSRRIGSAIAFAVAFLFLPHAKAESNQWAFGLGMESRVQREVNPDYANLQNTPELYARFRAHPYVALLEVGQQTHDTSSGSLSIRSQSTNVALWGRYEFLERAWTPFLSAGAGSYFDRVETHFESSSDARTGRRALIGAGAGVSATVWQNLLLELEVRASGVQNEKDPLLTSLFRVGFQFNDYLR
jgi:opacity protein-like surface antigen